MEKTYEYVDQFDDFVLRKLDDYDDLKIYRFKDFDLQRVRELLKFNQEAFGQDAIDKFAAIFQIYYGNIFVLKERRNDAKILGIANFSRAWDENKLAYLSDYAIAEEARGQSIGKEFLGIVLEDIKNQGFQRVQLTVDPDNEPALALYESLGFKKDKFVEKLYGPGEDRYIMDLDLDQLQRN